MDTNGPLGRADRRIVLRFKTSRDRCLQVKGRQWVAAKAPKDAQMGCQNPLRTQTEIPRPQGWPPIRNSKILFIIPPLASRMLSKWPRSVPKMRMNRCVVFVLGGLLFCGASRADIVFSQGVSNTGTDNVLFNTPADITGPALTVQGHIQNVGTNVSVTSNENLIVNNDSGGQATISAQTPGFTVADISFPAGGTSGKILFPLSGLGKGQAGMVPFTIKVTEGNGTTDSASFTTGAGNTFYTVVAINGQDIR